MKKNGVLTLIVCGGLFLADCHPKVYPTTAEKTKTTEVTTSTTSTVTNAQLEQGKLIYEGSCGKCHDLPKPGEYTIKSWDNILPSMIHKANMEADKGVMVRAYVVANAKAS